jgi:hypothetical protein
VRGFLLTFIGLVLCAPSAFSQEWSFQESEDKITKEKRSIAFIAAKKWDRSYGFRDYGSPELFIVCKKSGLEAYIRWDALISCGSIGVEYRTPSGKIVKSSWTGSTDCKANFISGGKLFMKSIGVGGDLPLRYTPRSGKITEMDWQFPDPQTIREKMPPHCRW